MLIKFEQVEYTYPLVKKAAIANLNLTLKSGQKYGIIGRNGCGKTTLFRLMNGLYRPQKGVIRWQGNLVKYNNQYLTELRQKVGLVFQDPEQQLVGMTVEEDLSYGLYNLGLNPSTIADKIRQTLDHFALTDLAYTPVNHLSLGQKKRLSIADIMILKPQLLLLDEPTAYLDPYQTYHLLDTLEKIHQEGTTIVMATHHLDLIYSWADWIFVMDEGTIKQEGTPEKIFNQKEFLEDLGLNIPFSVNLWNAISQGEVSPNSSNQLRQWMQQQWRKQ